MKKNSKNFRQRASIIILLCFLMNIIMPNLVLAEEVRTSGDTITVSIERRVLGEEDILKEKKFNITKGERASTAILRIFKENNIEYRNNGSEESGFYLSGIKTKDTNEWLSEFKHGSLSGWKYSVNGKYPNVGFSDYYLENGDNLRIQYTAKDMGEDILVVDKIFAIRDKIAEAEKLNKNDYTSESFQNLEKKITDTKALIPSDIEIGQMMSDVLGNGDCDTAKYSKKLDLISEELVQAIETLEKKPEIPELPDANLEPEMTIKPQRWCDFNTIYLEPGKKFKRVQLDWVEAEDNPIFNGKKLEPINGKYIIDIPLGINTFTMDMFGSPTDVIMTCKTLPYTVEGNVAPGETITVKLPGIEEAVKHTPGEYELEQTQLRFNSDIPGLKSVNSETFYGKEVDREKLGTLTFTIPKETQIGEYTLSGGRIFQDWFGTSIDGWTQGDFSVFPNIKLNVVPNVDKEKVYNIDLSKWTKYDKVYTTENKVALKLEGINETSVVTVNSEKISNLNNEYIAEIKIGDNIINVDGKDYNVFCKKISYEVKNPNAIVPGSRVVVKFDGLEEAFTYIPSIVNPHTIKTVYNTNLEGLDKVESEKAGSFTQVYREKLNTVKFTIPKNAKPGTYAMTNGNIYQGWYGQSINGSDERNFSILPRVNFKVREGISEDKEAPSISTTLKEMQDANKVKFNFDVMVVDNIDSDITPTVKLNNEIINTENEGKYSVSLSEGKNIISIEAIDNAGNRTYKEYVVNLKIILREGSSIILDTLNLEMDKGQTHQLIAVDAHDARGHQLDDTAFMTYKVIDGNDVIGVNSKGIVEAKNYGFGKISVRYPGLDTPAIVYVHVKDPAENNGPEITTDIKASKYDILYFAGENHNYNFNVQAPEADSVEVTVNDNVVSSKEKELYSANLKEGYNTIKITAKKGDVTSYKTYTVRAKKAEVKISNLSNEGKEILQGDRVRIEFKGLETPVPKFLRVYNPKTTRVNYSTDIPGVTNIYGKGTQYDIATKNAIEFVATKAGNFNFSKGYIEEEWWGDNLYSERDISSEGPNTNASVREGNFSTLPEFNFAVKENPNYVEKFVPTVENEDNIKAGDEVTINIKGLTMPEKDSGGIVEARTIFETNIPGVKTIASEDASYDEGKLNVIKFKLPQDVKPGTYTITNGRVFKEWSNNIGLHDKGEFYKGEIPEIHLVVKAVDTNKPVISGADDISIKEGTAFDNMAGVTAKDTEDGDITKNIKVSGNVDINKPGKYELEYSVSDAAGNTETIKRVVTVNAKMSELNVVPVINAEDKIVKLGDTFDPIKGVTAKDKEDGNITKNIKVVENKVDTNKVGVYTVKYEVTDSKGARTTKTIIVTVRSNDKPVILGVNNISIKRGDSFDKMTGITAKDTEDGDITKNIKVAGAVDINKPGKYELEYSVTDSDGNTETAMRIVTVENKDEDKNTTKPQENGNNKEEIVNKDTSNPITRDFGILAYIGLGIAALIGVFINKKQR